MSDSRDTMDCIPPGSSVCGILQTRVLELVAISFKTSEQKIFFYNEPESKYSRFMNWGKIEYIIEKFN